MVEAALFYKVLYWHLIPSASTVILTAGFLILIAKIFGLKNPRWRYWLFLLPLAKGFVILVSGVPPPPPVPTSKPIMLGLKLWDPFNLISVPSAFDNLPSVLTAADQMVIGAIFLVLLALVWRWGSLFVFYRSLRGEELHPEDAPRVFQMLGTLVGRMRTPFPKVMVCDKPYVLPCLIGVLKPTIVLSPEIAETSSEDILEAILAHELAHLKRHDNLVHWASIILKDLLIFNPFAHLIFPKILEAKEQDCDHVAADATGKPEAVARAIIHVATMASRENKKFLPGSMSEQVQSFSAGKLINRRIDMLLSGAAGKQKVFWAKGCAIALLAIFSFFVHIQVTGPAPALSPIFQF